jgi:uncharacterized protein (TIGR02246 family)
MKPSRFFFPFLALLAMPGLATSPSRPSGRASLAEVRRAIDAGNATWQKAFRTLDAAAIAATFDDEGVNLGADGTCSKGHAAIEAGMRSFFERSGPATATKVEVQQVVLDGDLAYEWGHSEFRFGPKPGGPAERAGRYLTAWKQQADGGWKIYRNVGLPKRP